MRSLEEVYDRVQEIPFVAEFKYDGQRAQIHASTGKDGCITIKIFSRHLEDMTDKVRYPLLPVFNDFTCHRSTPMSSRFSRMYINRTGSWNPSLSMPRLWLLTRRTAQHDRFKTYQTVRARLFSCMKCRWS